MDVQILYMTSRCSKSQAFYFQAIIQKYLDRFGSLVCAHLSHERLKMACWNVKNFNLWIFSGGLSSLRLMWNIEKPRTHSRTRKWSLLIDWFQTFYPRKPKIFECCDSVLKITTYHEIVSEGFDDLSDIFWGK